MGIKRMNHAVLYVRDVERTFTFYRDMLGFRQVAELPQAGAKFLQAPDSTNDHDLGLFQIGAAAGDSTAGRSTVGLYHLAWEVQTLSDLQDIAQRLAGADALTGATDHGTTKALYGRDPDGLEFEVCWLVPAEQVSQAVLDQRMQLRPLNIPAEIDRYGADTLGGIGVSEPVAAG